MPSVGSEEKGNIYIQKGGRCSSAGISALQKRYHLQSVVNSGVRGAAVRHPLSTETQASLSTNLSLCLVVVNWLVIVVTAFCGSSKPLHSGNSLVSPCHFNWMALPVHRERVGKRDFGVTLRRWRQATMNFINPSK